MIKNIICKTIVSVIVTICALIGEIYGIRFLWVGLVFMIGAIWDKE